jgi:denticleless
MDISELYSYIRHRHSFIQSSDIMDLRPTSQIETIEKCYSIKYSNNDSSVMSACDESGEIYLISLATQPEILSQMQAHKNSIFHICWSCDDRYLLTASADQTGGVWDMQKLSGSLLSKHTGSVKCIKNSPTSPNVYATASRDGKIYIWDLRANGSSSTRDTIYHPVAEITQTSEIKKKKKRKEPASFTGLEYMPWGTIIASVEADEADIRFWDVRKLGSVKEKKKVTRTKPCLGFVSPWTYKQNSTLQSLLINKSKEKILEYNFHNQIRHSRPGNSWICCSNNSLLVSSIGNCMYYYRDILRLEYDPPVKFEGFKSSFYVKGCISPDNSHVATGSSDGLLYIWDVKKPEMPFVLQTGHMLESSCVDWTQGNHSFIASSSDASLVIFWDYDEINLS